MLCCVWLNIFSMVSVITKLKSICNKLRIESFGLEIATAHVLLRTYNITFTWIKINNVHVMLTLVSWGSVNI